MVNAALKEANRELMNRTTHSRTRHQDGFAHDRRRAHREQSVFVRPKAQDLL